jgi:hypothetical protein
MFRFWIQEQPNRGYRLISLWLLKISQAEYFSGSENNNCQTQADTRLSSLWLLQQSQADVNFVQVLDTVTAKHRIIQVNQSLANKSISGRNRFCSGYSNSQTQANTG